MLLALLNAGNRLDVNDSVGDVVVPIIVHGIFEQVFVREDERLMLLDSLTVNVSSEEIDKTASIALLEVPSRVLLDLRA